jgi:hypothetical protein
MSRLLAALAVFVPFTAFSTWVIAQDGYLGFVPPALDGRWGTQVFLDLCISLTLATLWLVPDAKRRGINPWPFVASLLPLGSIGALAYLVWREVKALRPSAQPATA